MSTRWKWTLRYAASQVILLRTPAESAMATACCQIQPLASTTRRRCTVGRRDTFRQSLSPTASSVATLATAFTPIKRRRRVGHSPALGSGCHCSARVSSFCQVDRRCEADARSRARATPTSMELGRGLGALPASQRADRGPLDQDPGARSRAGKCDAMD